MKHIYPAYRLDELYTKHKVKYSDMVKRMREVRLEHPEEKEPELKDSDYMQMLCEVRELHDKVEEEQYVVTQEYKNLFSMYHITIEELAIMFDLDKLYIERHIMPNVRTMYLNRHIRRYIKSCHRIKMKCELDGVIHHYDIDYEKKVFIHRGDLEQWLFNHCESNDILITEQIIKYCLHDRKKAVMHSTETIKKKYGLKYNVQLQRLNLDRIYMMATDDRRPLSRIPSERLLSFIMD